MTTTWIIECPICRQIIYVEQDEKPSVQEIGVARSLPGHTQLDAAGVPMATRCPGTGGPGIVHASPIDMDHSHPEDG